MRHEIIDTFRVGLGRAHESDEGVDEASRHEGIQQSGPSHKGDGQFGFDDAKGQTDQGHVDFEDGREDIHMRRFAAGQDQRKYLRHQQEE